MCLTSQINKLESDLSKQEQYIKYLYSVIEGYEEEIEDLRKKNSKLRVQLKDALETSSFKEECIVSLEQKIDEIENKNIELKERILEYSSKVNNGVMDPRPTQDAFSVSDLTGPALKQNILDHAIRMLNRLVHLDNTRKTIIKNNRNSRQARELYQRDTTRLRREKNACIQQAQNWRGRERNAQNQINNLNQQIINLQNNPPQNIRMAAAYAPPTFSG